MVETTNNGGDLVRYKNAINQAAWRLTAMEQRLMLTAVSKISNSTTGLTPITVAAKELIDLGSDEKSVYRDMRSAASTLFRRYLSIFYDGENDYEEIRWLWRSRYIKSSGSVQLWFSPALLPYLKDLQSQFTQYGRLELKGLDSQYAMRLYSLLMQFKQTGWFQISLDDLKKRLDLADRFERYTDFRRFVLEIAKKQINNGECTTIKFSYEPIKTGRSVTALKFHIRLKTNRQPPDIEVEAVERKPTTAKQRRYIADILAGKAAYEHNGERFDASRFLSLLYAAKIVPDGDFRGLDFKASSDKFMELLMDPEFCKSAAVLLKHWGIYL